MPHFLIYQLKAPLCSFGSGMAELRLSDTSPRKSAITGMLAGALGILRTESGRFKTLVDSLQLAVLTLREPKIMVDFHTVQAPVERFEGTRADQVRGIQQKIQADTYKGTIVTKRQYLQDGHWLIAIHASAEHLPAWKFALEFPKFAPYLGRKSCPLSAFTAPVLVEADSVEAAYSAWSDSTGVGLLRSAGLPFKWDAGFPTTPIPLSSTTRNDVRTSLLSNHFASRTENVGTLEIGA